MARGTIIPRKAKDGGRRYECRIRLDGRQSSKTFSRKIDAESWLDKMSAETRDGSYRQLKASTFGNYVELWSSVHLISARLKPSTINSYASNLAKHIVPAFAIKPIASIDSSQVSKFESDLLRSGNAPKSVRNIMLCLNRVLSDAVRDGYVRHNPMNGSKLAPVPKTEASALTAEDARELLSECSGDLELVVMLGLLAGLRRAEIFALRWTDVDFDGNSIRVSRAVFWRYGRYQDVAEGEPAFTFTTPKSKTSIRTVDLSPELKRQLLKAYMRSTDKDGLIFQTRAGTPHNPDNFYRRTFKPAAARAGLPAIGLHTLRHTFGSWKIRQWEDVVYVSRQLGHASVSITANVYAHLIDARRPEAAAKTDAYLFGAAL